MRPRLGQHFLRDGRVVERILSAAELLPGQRVLEVGPGEGVLTFPLLELVLPGGSVVTVEADRGLAARLEDAAPEGLELHVGDVMDVDLAALGPFDRVVSNLPYQISGPFSVALLDLLVSPASRWGRAVLMVQKEFGERLLAGPGSGDYGRLSVHAARRVSVRRLFGVPPGAFDPPPRVQSVVLELVPHEVPPFDVVDEGLWRAVVDGSFQQRRKQLRNTVPSVVAGWGVPREAALGVLEDLGLVALRPQDVPPETFAALVAGLAAARRA